jgi:hypothetical protein
MGGPFISALIGGFMTVAGSLVGRVLLALGMGYVSYTGFNASAGWLLDQIKANMGSMGADTVSFLAWLWVDKAIGLIFSAYSAALVVKMAGGTKLTKLVTKGS